MDSAYITINITLPYRHFSTFAISQLYHIPLGKRSTSYSRKLGHRHPTMVMPGRGTHGLKSGHSAKIGMGGKWQVYI